MFYRHALRGLIFAMVAMATFAAKSAVPILSGPVINPANGHTYYLLDQSDWTSAEAEAVSLGGHLATINEPLEEAGFTQGSPPLQVQIEICGLDCTILTQ